MTTTHKHEGLTPAWVRYGAYPLLLMLTLAYLFWELSRDGTNPGRGYGVYLGFMVSSLFALERFFPLRRAWSARWVSFWRRDVPMMLMNGAAIGLATFFMTKAQAWAPLAAPRWAISPWLGGVCAILVADFLWYWVHRCAHEADRTVSLLLGFGPARYWRGLKNWLWRTHGAHHQPRQVYLFMHVVSHPINSFYVRLILLLPGACLGLDRASLLVAGVLTAFQGLVSHLNADLRAGWLNYLLIGTELHRYHHSASADDRGNYGAVVSLWDGLFGTRCFHPGQIPQTLGLAPGTAYPAEGDWWGLLRWPWQRAADPAGESRGE